MKHLGLFKHFLLIFTAYLFFFSCHESASPEVSTDDKDMIAATELANTVVDSDEARKGRARSVTVLKYSRGKLLFATNTDDEGGYQEVTEQTITAFLEAGEQHFWYAGSGITDLVAIELDAASQSSITCSPEEVISGQLWRIAIPTTISSEVELKYDIVYQFRGNAGAPIRLDPKLKVEDPE